MSLTFCTSSPPGISCAVFHYRQCIDSSFSFFFQAEDGIRDTSVTGVQTCALPICVHANLAELDRQLSQQQVCARLAIEGGWYAVLRVPVTQSDEDLAVAIVRDACVLVHPGHFYDFPTDGFLVLSLITQPQEFCEGVRRILKFLA